MARMQHDSQGFKPVFINEVAFLLAEVRVLLEMNMQRKNEC